MIIGIYDQADDSAIALPLDAAAAAIGVTPYRLRKAVAGESIIPGKIVVKLPNDAVLRPPPS